MEATCVITTFCLMGLLVLFVTMFGLVSWTKYQKGGLTIEHSTHRSVGGNLLPGITICPFHEKPRTPWRNGSAALHVPEAILLTECNSSTAEDMLACIKSKTYQKEDVVVSLSVPKDRERKDFRWVSTYGGGVVGFCHTLIHPHPIGTNLNTDSFWMILKPTLSYDIYLHDPNFFWPTVNPATFPNARMTLTKDDYGVRLLYVDVKKHIKLNTPSNPCALGECLTTFIAKNNLSTMSTMDEILSTETLLTDMVFATQGELVELTGCQKHCEYIEYSLAGAQQDTKAGN